MAELLKASTLLFVLLNPFLMSIYLLDLVQGLEPRHFTRVLTRAGIISGAVFIVFAWFGDRIFTDVLNVRFASFLIFGGIIFLIVGVRFVMAGSDSLRPMRGQPEYLAGSVAMPFMIGPATVSASILIGSRLPPLAASAAVVLALLLVVAAIVGFKWLHDFVKTRNERLIERYIDIVGRITALVIGTYAVEMILQGVETWLRAGTWDSGW